MRSSSPIPPAGLRRFAGVLAAALLAGLLVCGSAAAKRPLELGFADPLFKTADRERWLSLASDAGADWTKVFISWRSLVRNQEPSDPRDPRDPQYRFDELDAAVLAAEAEGHRIVIAPFLAPEWAEESGRPDSAGPGTWRPSPPALGQLMAALTERYQGGFVTSDGGSLPRVDAFQIWNEPNVPEYLNPQWDGSTSAAAEHYRDMLNAAYDGVRSVDNDVLIITAGTAPYGDDSPGRRTRPLVFWREVFCLRANLKPAPGACEDTRFDAFAHHPINTSFDPEVSAFHPDDAASADLAAVVKILRAAEAAGVAPGGKHPVWASEFWWGTNPPHALKGVRPRAQARFIAESLYLYWKAGAEVVIKLRIRDAEIEQARDLDSAASGIYFSDGKAKPGLAAFRFPFVVDRRGKKASAWGKSPRRGRVKIQLRKKGGWRTVAKTKAGSTKVFRTRFAVARGDRVRARCGAAVSPTYKVKGSLKPTEPGPGDQPRGS